MGTIANEIGIGHNSQEFERKTGVWVMDPPESKYINAKNVLELIRETWMSVDTIVGEITREHELSRGVLSQLMYKFMVSDILESEVKNNTLESSNVDGTRVSAWQKHYRKKSS